MKNKTLIIKIFIYFFFVFFSNKVFSDDLIFNGPLINSDNENIIKAINGVNVVDPSGLIINSDEIEFNKETSLLIAKGNVVVFDKINNNTLRSNEIIYNKLSNIINTKNFTIIEIDKTHIIETSNIIYDANLKKISSKNKTTIKDMINNEILVSEFNYSILDKIFKAENADATDKDDNKYKIEKLRFNLLQNKLIGKDISVNFNNKLFNSLDNQPRLKGNAIFLDKDKK